MLATLLLVSTLFHAKALLLWNTVRCGMAAQEAGFIVYDDGSFGPMVTTNDTPGHGEIKFPALPHAAAYVHSHPNNLQDKPSAGDIQAAKKSGKFVYVISRSGLWQVAPDGKVTQIHDGTSWLK